MAQGVELNLEESADGYLRRWCDFVESEIFVLVVIDQSRDVCLLPNVIGKFSKDSRRRVLVHMIDGIRQIIDASHGEHLLEELYS